MTLSFVDYGSAHGSPRAQCSTHASSFYCPDDFAGETSSLQMRTLDPGEVCSLIEVAQLAQTTESGLKLTASYGMSLVGSCKEAL